MTAAQAKPATARRGSLIAGMKQAADKVEASAAAGEAHSLSAEPLVTTAISLPKAAHSLLRRVAVERAVARGGRPSVSAVLTSLVQRHWAELEQEIGRN